MSEGGGLLSMMKGWAKFKPPPNFVQKEEQLKTMDPGEKLSMAYVMEQLDILIKNSTGSMKSQFEYVKADLIIDQKKNAYAEEFIEEFILWILGRSCKNVRYEHQEFNPNGQRVIDVDDPKEVTPWGNTPYTHLDDVKDFLDQIVDNRMAAIKYITKLKLRYPRNLADLWFWWKYIVHKQGVDGAIINYARWLEPYDFIPPDKVPYDPQTGDPQYIYYGGTDKWQDPQVRVGTSPDVDDYNLVNPNPPPYNPERAKYLTEQLFTDMNAGLSGNLTLDEFMEQYSMTFHLTIERNAYAFCKMDLENIKTRIEADIMKSNIPIEEKQNLLLRMGFYNQPDQRTADISELTLLLKTHLARGVNAAIPNIINNNNNTNFVDTTPILREIKQAVENGSVNLWGALNSLYSQMGTIGSSLAWDSNNTMNFRNWMYGAINGINNSINSKNTELKVVVENMSNIPPAPPIVDVVQQVQPLQENKNIVDEMMKTEAPVDLSGLEKTITDLTSAISMSTKTGQDILTELREYIKNAPESGASKGEIGVLFNSIVDRVNSSSSSYFKAMMRDLKRSYGSNEVKASGISSASMQDLALLQNQMITLQQQRLSDTEKINSLSTKYMQLQGERDAMKEQGDKLNAVGNQLFKDKQTFENLSKEQAEEIIRLREENLKLSSISRSGGELSAEAKAKFEENEKEITNLKNANTVSVNQNKELALKISTQAEELKRAQQTLNNAITNHELKTSELDKQLSDSRKTIDSLTSTIEQAKLNWQSSINSLNSKYQAELKGASEGIKAQLAAQYNADKAALEAAMKKDLESQKAASSAKIESANSSMITITENIIQMGKEKDDAEAAFRQHSESTRQREKEIEDIMNFDISLLDDAVELSVGGIPMEKKTYDPRDEPGYSERDEDLEYQENIISHESMLSDWDNVAEQKEAENFILSVINTEEETGGLKVEKNEESYWDYFINKKSKKPGMKRNSSPEREKGGMTLEDRLDIHKHKLERMQKAGPAPDLSEVDMEWEETGDLKMKGPPQYWDYIDKKIKKIEENKKRSELRLSMANALVNNDATTLLQIDEAAKSKWSQRRDPKWSPNEKTASAWASNKPLNPILADPSTGELKTLDAIQSDQGKLSEVAAMLTELIEEDEETLSELKRKKSSIQFAKEKYTNSDFITDDDPVQKIEEMKNAPSQSISERLKQIIAQITPSAEVAKRFGYESLSDFEAQHLEYIERFASENRGDPEKQVELFFSTLSKIYYERDIKRKNADFMRGFLESLGGTMKNGLENFTRDTGPLGIEKSYPEVAEAWRNLKPDPMITSMMSKYNPGQEQENYYYNSSKSFLDLISKIEDYSLPLNNAVADFGNALSSKVNLNAPLEYLNRVKRMKEYFLSSIQNDINAILKPSQANSAYFSNIEQTLWQFNTTLKTLAMKSGFNAREIAELDLDDYVDEERLVDDPYFKSIKDWSSGFLSEVRPLLQSNVKERERAAREQAIKRGTKPEYYFSGSEFRNMTRDIYKSPRDTTQFIVPHQQHGMMKSVSVTPEEAKKIFGFETNYKKGRINEEQYRFGITNILKKYTDRAPMTVDQMANFINPGAGIPINDVEKEIPISEQERARRREVNIRASAHSIKASSPAIKFPRELQASSFSNMEEVEGKRAQYVNDNIVARKYDQFLKDSNIQGVAPWNEISDEKKLNLIRTPEQIRAIMNSTGITPLEIDYAEKYILSKQMAKARAQAEEEERRKRANMRTHLQRAQEDVVSYTGKGHSLR